MKLAKYKIINIDSILVASRINRIADKEVKDALLKEYLEIHKIAEAAKADQNEISRKFNADWREEATAVAKYRNAGKPVVGHLDFLDAERDAEKAIQDLLKAEVDIDITPAPMDDIMAVSEDITLGQIAMLQEYGIIE
jgi:hypothetical protein